MKLMRLVTCELQPIDSSLDMYMAEPTPRRAGCCRSGSCVASPLYSPSSPLFSDSSSSPGAFGSKEVSYAVPPCFVVMIVESFCDWRTKIPGRGSLSPIAQESIATFQLSAKPTRQRDIDEESTSLVSSARNTRARGSFASVLEMMSLTLAVTPSPSENRGPVLLGESFFLRRPCSEPVLTKSHDAVRNRDLG